MLCRGPRKKKKKNDFAEETIENSIVPGASTSSGPTQMYFPPR